MNKIKMAVTLTASCLLLHMKSLTENANRIYTRLQGAIKEKKIQLKKTCSNTATDELPVPVV